MKALTFDQENKNTFSFPRPLVLIDLAGQDILCFLPMGFLFAYYIKFVKYIKFSKENSKSLGIMPELGDKPWHTSFHNFSLLIFQHIKNIFFVYTHTQPLAYYLWIRMVD